MLIRAISSYVYGKQQNVNLSHMTKFFLNFCFYTVHYFYPKISSFNLVLSLTIFCFGLFFAAHFLFGEILNLNLTFAICRKWDSKSLHRNALNVKISDF